MILTTSSWIKVMGWSLELFVTLWVQGLAFENGDILPQDWNILDVHFVERDLFISQEGILCYHSKGQNHLADSLLHVNRCERLWLSWTSAVTFVFYHFCVLWHRAYSSQMGICKDKYNQNKMSAGSTTLFDCTHYFLWDITF